MMNLVKRFRKEEKGATAIEYGLLAALIGIAIIVGAQTVGGQLNNSFDSVSEEMCEAGGGTYTNISGSTQGNCVYP